MFIQANQSSPSHVNITLKPIFKKKKTEKYLYIMDIMNSCGSDGEYGHGRKLETFNGISELDFMWGGKKRRKKKEKKKKSKLLLSLTSVDHWQFAVQVFQSLHNLQQETRFSATDTLISWLWRSVIVSNGHSCVQGWGMETEEVHLSFAQESRKYPISTASSLPNMYFHC